MVTIIELEDIRSILKEIDVHQAIEYGFIAYSNGKTVVPPVGELLFDEPKGEAHIKYGYIKGDEHYCIKIASGFYDNPALGIASNQGMMLLFNQKTGQPQAILLDDGYLTDVRTAAAGVLAAKYFAPKNIKGIGIVGTGVQAKFQLEFLLEHLPCKTVWIWGRTIDKVHAFIGTLDPALDTHVADSTRELASNCNLIVTATASHQALLFAEDIQAGTHITAMGSDTAEKQELDSELFLKADLIISDSLAQSKSRGEIYKAVSNGVIDATQVVELGNAIQHPELQRSNETQISIVDLTGVAVQDIMIAKTVYNNFMKR